MGGRKKWVFVKAKSQTRLRKQLCVLIMGDTGGD